MRVRLPMVHREERDAERRLNDLLDLLDLRELAPVQAGSLPFGTQKRVELARALIGEPKLLLLDEPAGGLNHGEVDELAQLLQRIRSHFSMSILLVEHHMNLVMRVSDKVVALEFGMKIADGTPERGAQRAGSDPRLSRRIRRRSMPALLEAKGLHAGYGETKVLHGLDFAVAGRRRDRAAGRQRRRQDHDAAGDLRRHQDAGRDLVRRGADRQRGHRRPSCGAASHTCRTAAAPSWS